MIFSYIIPVFLLVIIIHARYKKVDIFNAFIDGASENIKVAFEVFPALLGLVVCVGLLNTCGILGFLTLAISPVTEFLGFSSECAGLALIKPISGSGGTAMLSSIFKKRGPDSFTGRVASVICGSTETLFYSIAVYFGGLKLKGTWKIIVASIVADITAFISANILVKLWFN